MDGYEALEARILAWAAAREDLLAGVVVGSRARMDGTADQWSDLDLILFTSSPQNYQQRSTWLGEFGELWAALLSHAGSGYPEWFALYAGGLKIDIVFVPAKPADRHELRKMLEWHARAVFGPERDIWYEGRFVADWIDPRVLSDLPGTFAAYDRADLKRGLVATLALYRRLANEVAAILNYERLSSEEQIAAWISDL